MLSAATCHQMSEAPAASSCSMQTMTDQLVQLAARPSQYECYNGHVTQTTISNVSDHLLFMLTYGPGASPSNLDTILKGCEARTPPAC